MSQKQPNKLIVCDLCLSNEIHETINLGFLYGLSLISPKQEIIFFADQGHQRVIKENINHKALDLEALSYISLPANLNSSIKGYLTSYLRIKSILDYQLQHKSEHLLVLSSVSFQRLILKTLLTLKKYQHINCTFVMHGDLDDLVSIKHKDQEVAGTYFTHVANAQKTQEVAGTYSGTYSNLRKKLIHLCTPSIDFKKHLLTNHSPQVRYIVLAPHILDRLSDDLPHQSLGFYYLPHPAVFSASDQPIKVKHQTQKQKLKCAIFGYGNPPVLMQLNQILSNLWRLQNQSDDKQSTLEDALEIRIVGSNHQGAEFFPWVTSPITHRALSRLEMEKLAADIDLFLILYEPHRYQLSCSGSIIEAFSYLKPVYHLTNPCIDGFNPKSSPIGKSFGHLEALAQALIQLMNNPKQKEKELNHYKANMLKVRPLLDIRHNLPKLKLALGLS